jgi:3D (Asp-Asp-Asp) domain-containing protein
VIEGLGPEQGPIGTLGVPLTPGRSIAVDPAHVPLGAPVWIEARDPVDGAPIRRLVVAQDTGGAIRGRARGDLFFGWGEAAERRAGLMQDRGARSGCCCPRRPEGGAGRRRVRHGFRRAPRVPRLGRPCPSPNSGPAARVALFVTCLVDLYRPNVGFSAIALLEAAGCTVEVPPTQTCCGQPAYNTGDRAGARDLARAVVDAFLPYDHVVAPSGAARA